MPGDPASAAPPELPVPGPGVRSIPTTVLFLHGFHLDSSADCAEWRTLIGRLRDPSDGYAFTGPLETVQYYRADAGCSLDLTAGRDGAFDNHTPIETLALALNEEIAARYAGRKVALVGYSMGGLIATRALVGARLPGGAGRFRSLDDIVVQVVTLGTPFGGSGPISVACEIVPPMITGAQCRQFLAGAVFLRELAALRACPAAEVTTFGSFADLAVPPASSLAYGCASTRILYDRWVRPLWPDDTVTHGDYFRKGPMTGAEWSVWVRPPGDAWRYGPYLGPVPAIEMILANGPAGAAG